MTKKLTPDFEGAKKRAEQILLTLNKDKYLFHGEGNPKHTTEEVRPAAEILVKIEGIEGEDLLILNTAVNYHDTGFVRKYRGHEDESIAIAREELPRFNYPEEKIERVVDLIEATRLHKTETGMRQKPGNDKLRQIIADADLSNFGNDSFFLRSTQLMLELERLGLNFTPTSDLKAWYEHTYNFVKGHKYFTISAKRLWDEKKYENLRQIARILK